MHSASFYLHLFYAFGFILCIQRWVSNRCSILYTFIVLIFIFVQRAKGSGSIERLRMFFCWPQLLKPWRLRLYTSTTHPCYIIRQLSVNMADLFPLSTFYLYNCGFVVGNVPNIKIFNIVWLKHLWCIMIFVKLVYLYICELSHIDSRRLALFGQLLSSANLTGWSMWEIKYLMFHIMNTRRKEVK